MYCKEMCVNEEKPSKLEFLKELTADPDNALLFFNSDNDFFNPKYCGKFKDINNLLIDIDNQERMTQTNSSEMNSVFFAKFLTACILVNEWSKSKQIYTFDPELELALSAMDGVKIPVHILDRAPYNSFYIEFSKEGIFSSNFHGVFVKIVKNLNEYVIFFSRVTEDGESVNVSSFRINENKDGFCVINRLNDIGTENCMELQEFFMFFLNAILYLCSENSEIKESETTKRTYKPSSTIKNKFSEIKKYECGFVYGETIRKNKKTSTPNNDNEGNKADDNSSSKKMRKGIRPHVRKAHWHHYWVGKKGSRNLVLLWIAPTHVGHGEKVATIHRCTE